MVIKKGNHCAYETHYHIVFPVKYRRALMKEEVCIEIKKISKEIEERYEIEMEGIGCDQNHIHLLCGFHPKYSVGKVVKIYKSVTAKQLFQKFSELKKDLWGGEFWSDGYYVGTVGERGNWKEVEKYIQEQGYRLEEVQLRLF